MLRAMVHIYGMLRKPQECVVCWVWFAACPTANIVAS